MLPSTRYATQGAALQITIAICKNTKTQMLKKANHSVTPLPELVEGDSFLLPVHKFSNIKTLKNAKTRRPKDF